MAEPTRDESYYVDCFYDPKPDCLSSLHLQTDVENDIWAAPQRKFDCLYDSWLDVAKTFTTHNITGQDGKFINSQIIGFSQLNLQGVNSLAFYCYNLQT